MAKNDETGNLVTNPTALKQVYLNAYAKRLAHRSMRPDLEDIFQLKTNLWKQRYRIISNNQSPNWNQEQLYRVLSKLKNNKAIDPDGLQNELFKPGCIGEDLAMALLCLFNQCKANQSIPQYMKLSNITSIYKNKGSRLCLENDRGIFIQTTLRKILDKLIYAECYENIDNGMSESNIGARKNRNIRDHLFILYAIINSVVKGGEDCIDIQVYDIEKAFDSLWLDESFNDLYDVLPQEKRNDSISLLYQSNITNLVAVNTPAGLTDRINLPSIIQQGGVWGSILCSNTIDTIGRKCKLSGEHLYMYKKRVEILPLGFVDDLNGVAKCGQDSINLNLFLNSQVELKKLSFHSSGKCVRMHVGRTKHECPTLKVHNKPMDNVNEITYLGDCITSDGKNTRNVQIRTQKGLGIICHIMKILRTVSFGSHSFDIALLLRESYLINGILTNTEIWYHLETSETRELEKVDRNFFQQLLGLPHSVPSPALFLETGVLPISVLIKVRRLNFLHSILRGPETGMLQQVFKIQWNFPCKGDWAIQAKNDFKDFEIEDNLEKIKTMSKDVFKRLTKRKAYAYAFNLLCLNKQTYRKMDRLSYSEFKVQKYLVNKSYSLEEKKLIFKYRTRMLNVGQNFRADRELVLCPLCKKHTGSQDNLLSCVSTIEDIEKECGDITGINLDELFAEEFEETTVKVLKRAMETRTSKLKGTHPCP